MKKQFNFIRFDNINEFENWLNKEVVTRKISRLQVHHMSLPNYTTWETTDKRIYKDNRELGRTKALDDYGKNKWNYKDSHNHYIAQHFNIFPNGKITKGRSLNSYPIGITGWNENAICLEIYGDFDKNKDIYDSSITYCNIKLKETKVHFKTTSSEKSSFEFIFSYNGIELFEEMY